MISDHLPQRVDLCTPRTVYGTASAVESPAGTFDFSLPATVYSGGGVLLNAQAGVLYLLDVFDFRVDRIDELNYVNSVFSTDPAYANKGALTLTLYWEGEQRSSQAQIYSLPLVRFASDSPLRIFTMPPSGEGSVPLKFRFDGNLLSSYWLPPLSPLPALLDAFVSIRMYEIRDAEFIRRYNSLGIGGDGLCRSEG